MSLRKIVKKILPSPAVALMKRAEKRIEKVRLKSMPPLNEKDFVDVLVARLGLVAGDTVFVHSSLDQLNPTFPPSRVLSLLLDVVGETGTLVFPTYPGVSSYEFLLRGMIFDVRKTPSFMGILTELARRQRNAVRSLHPTKSVCAIGRYARDLVSDHPASPYPFDRCSPYYKLMVVKGKIIGIGVSTTSLSFVHCVEDDLRQNFPVHLYHEQLFEARCVNYAGQIQIVSTYAHDLSKMTHDIPSYVQTYIRKEICEEMKIKQRRFFRAHSEALFKAMTELANAGIVIYQPSPTLKNSIKSVQSRRFH
jgi:aminoglycoside 3-N-acetyltransferase